MPKSHACALGNSVSRGVVQLRSYCYTAAIVLKLVYKRCVCSLSLAPCPYTAFCRMESMSTHELEKWLERKGYREEIIENFAGELEIAS